MLIVFPKNPCRESVQASNHHNATRNCIRRPSVHHWVRLQRRNRCFRGGTASEYMLAFNSIWKVARREPVVRRPWKWWRRGKEEEETPNHMWKKKFASPCTNERRSEIAFRFYFHAPCFSSPIKYKRENINQRKRYKTASCYVIKN